jgi:coenzyme F420-0:L-glutamate ligase / coenzyme F420-1:gamma-L-glutamate ligase
MISVIPIDRIGEVAAGADLATLIEVALDAQRVQPEAHDILVVTQKIVSKAESRMVDLRAVAPGPQAIAIAEQTRKDPRMVELVLAESSDVVRAVPNVLITRHRTGHVMANAGIDRSNLGPGDEERALLLPEDADRSAHRLQAALAPRWPGPLGVVVSDSFGRPWRNGVINVAIGAAGLPALIDRRGELDRDGRSLEVTMVALADMIASAAGLATGEAAEGIPAALVRGLRWDAPEVPASALVRAASEDLFR